MKGGTTVVCASCGSWHKISERKQSENYSGMYRPVVCPQCGAEGFISTRRAIKDMK